MGPRLALEQHMIPFLDLRGQHDALKAELQAASDHVLSRGIFILGEQLSEFESAFAAYCGAKYCIGVGTGLDALHLILRAYGIGAGDEVIVPAHTFIATWLAVSHAGATPIPVDVNKSTGNIDAGQIAAALSSRTRAIIPVHLYGQPADMDAVRNAVGGRDIRIIEDAAQAHGARHRGRVAGSLGDAAAFSFYPGKNLGALGDGGAIVTNDEVLAHTVRNLRNYGSDVKYRHDVIGWNSRLDELQAAFLLVKLRHLEAWNAARRAAAGTYLAALGDLPGLTLPAIPMWAEPVWHLFVVRSAQRDRLQSHLSAQAIGTLVHYPMPPHLQGAYRHLGLAAGSLPAAEAWANEALSLPLWPGVPTAPVISAIRQFHAA